MASSFAGTLRVEVGGSRSPGYIDTQVEAAVRQHARRTAQLSSRYRELTRRPGDPVFTMPLRVVLTSNGIPLPSTASRGRAPGDIVPTFDSSGARAFPTAYQTLLENTFTQARPAMNALFGMPAVGGPVFIKNYDADIQDRYAVAGGYYVPNAPGGPEVRFPIYQNEVSTSINYIHTLLLAYMGTSTYFADAFNEGLVRAATMAVARTPNSLPNSPSAGQIEATLDSLYDASNFYDWYNQPALAGPTFIAPNLLNTQLPPGGSTGGIFLVRYQMSGTAWGKVLAEYPGFISNFNAAYYAAPAAYPDEASLVALGQTVLNTLNGGPGATVESLSFAEWYQRQHILNTRLNAGTKVMLQAFPISPTAGSSDFGVFGLIVHAFRTDAQSNETLLAGKLYPVFFRPDNGRFFTSAQEDVIDISGAFGSAVPNFPGSLFGNAKYRVTVDMPFEGESARSYLPAGGVATGQNPTANEVYGTLTGFPALPSGATYSIRVDYVGGSATDIVAQNFAFGGRVTDPNFERAQPITVRVFRVSGASTTEVLNRRVNKGQGPIALDLRPTNAYTNAAINWPAGMRMLGIPGQPLRPNLAGILGVGTPDTLAAHYNANKGGYDLFPDWGGPTTGQGFFIRPNSAVNKTVPIHTSPDTPIVVHLRAGWNQVVNPFNSTLATTSVSVTTAAESLATFAEAQGDLIGTTMFGYTPDGGNPDVGTLDAVTSFPAGQAVFIRALRPEGAVLIFFPPASSAPTSRSVFGQQSLAPSTAPAAAWQAQMKVQSSMSGLTSTAWIGMDRTATNNYDPRFDSDIPAHPGGYQIWVEGQWNRPMHRDYRADVTEQVYRVRLSGLRQGHHYKFSLSQEGSRSITIRDLNTFWSKTGKSALDYHFYARGTEHILEITVKKTGATFDLGGGFGSGWGW